MKIEDVKAKLVTMQKSDRKSCLVPTAMMEFVVAELARLTAELELPEDLEQKIKDWEAMPDQPVCSSDVTRELKRLLVQIHRLSNP